MIFSLTKSHTHMLAEDLHTRDLFPGYKSDTRFSLLIVSQSPLHPHARQQAITVLHPLCKAASGSTSPQANLIKNFIESGTPNPEPHTALRAPHPVAHESFTDLLHRESQARRDALPPR